MKTGLAACTRSKNKNSSRRLSRFAFVLIPEKSTSNRSRSFVGLFPSMMTNTHTSTLHQTPSPSPCSRCL